MPFSRPPTVYPIVHALGRFSRFRPRSPSGVVSGDPLRSGSYSPSSVRGCAFAAYYGSFCGRGTSTSGNAAGRGSSITGRCRNSLGSRLWACLSFAERQG